MGFFSLTQDIAMDLGTANTIITCNGKIVVDGETNIDTKNCISLAYMFKNDTSINNVDLRKNKKSTWTTMNSMFYGCSSLNKYSFNYYATNLDEYYYHSSSSDYIANPKDVAYLFYHCTSLTTTTSNNYLIIDEALSPS